MVDNQAALWCNCFTLPYMAICVVGCGAAHIQHQAVNSVQVRTGLARYKLQGPCNKFHLLRIDAPPLPNVSQCGLCINTCQQLSYWLKAHCLPTHQTRVNADRLLAGPQQAAVQQ